MRFNPLRGNWVDQHDYFVNSNYSFFGVSIPYGAIGWINTSAAIRAMLDQLVSIPYGAIGWINCTQTTVI